MSSKKEFETRVPHYNVSNDDDFHLSSIQVNAVLRQKEFYTAFSDDVVEENKIEKFLALIMLAFGDNFLRTIQ